MTAGFGARFVMALAELLGKRVRAFAGEAGGAVRVSGCLASAAGLHPFELPSTAGGLPLVRAGLHLAIRQVAGELVGEGSFVPVGEGLDKNAMPARLIARDFGDTPCPRSEIRQQSHKHIRRPLPILASASSPPLDVLKNWNETYM